MDVEEKPFAGYARVKVSPEDFRHVFKASEKWPEIAHPERYDWYLVEDVAIELMDPPTREDYENDPMLSRREINAELRRVDRVIEVVAGGGRLWPVVIGLDGIILDGYHRLAAANELGIETVDVLYPAKR